MKVKMLVVLIGIIGVVTACYLIVPEWFKICDTHNRGDGVMVCESPHQRTIGDPLLPLSLTFLAFSLFTLSLSRKVYKRWAIFSLIYGLVVWALLAFIPEIGGGLGGISFTILDVEGFAKLYAGLYAIISLAFFIIPTLLKKLLHK